MEDAIYRLQSQVRALLETGGGEIPAVTPYRFTAEHIPMPQREWPYLYLVLDGVLRLHTPSGMLDYMAGQYSISQIDIPPVRDGAGLFRPAGLFGGLGGVSAQPGRPDSPEPGQRAD